MSDGDAIIDNLGNFSGNARPTTILVWLLVMAMILIGGYKLTHLHRSHDQQILLDKSR